MAGKGGGTGIALESGAVEREPRTGRLATGAGLTPMQQSFVRHYIEGINGTKSAELAGFAHPEQDSYRLRRNPGVMQAIREGVAARILTEGPKVAVSVLLEVAQDKAQSGAARVSASKALLQAGGFLRGEAERADPLADKPLAERTLAELDAFIAGGNARVAELREREARTIDADAPEDARKLGGPPAGS